MSIIHQALFWALAILLVALTGATGLIPERVATSLVTVLPLVMVAIIAGRRRRCAKA
ncbi:MAG: hypothetical protein KF780_02960 [Sphingomonas sp.]|nr:hypothetical protein [Sphingomonas sp.]